MTARKQAKKVAKKAAMKVPAKVARERKKPAGAALNAGADVLSRVRGSKEAVTVGKAGGRPMLSWVGKRAPASVQAFPAQLVETYGDEVPNDALWQHWPDDLRRGGLLYHGDNKEVLAHLLANGFRGQVKLIYIDPPFDSGADYVRKVELRGPKGKVKLDGEGYTLGEQIQYTDIWANDNYLQFMYERLLLLKELLAEDGSIYVHMDSANVHAIKVVCDEVFGVSNFQREIIWRIGWISGYKSAAKNWIRNHDTILFYSKNKDRFTFNKEYIPYPEGYVRRDGAAPDGAGYPIEDTWNCYEIDSLDSIQIMSFNSEKVGYPTQKNESLLSRIVRASSNPGDLILDSFIGSGTTAAVSQKLGRRWIGCDLNKGAIQTTAKRLQLVMADQAGKNGPSQGKLLGEGDMPSPAQLGFSHWRVNDYDLAIQHNEAVKLACEYLGVERVRNDAFFDGQLGKRLVKIIPFGHPLSPVDLETIRDELDARPDEDRAITVVCLGKELASDAWLAEWNRLRKKKTDPHHIEVIELRNDPKYGGFLRHEKAQARVAVKRQGGKLHVEIKDLSHPASCNAWPSSPAWSGPRSPTGAPWSIA
ncbi:MAG: site-specific DNA-methyltransferase [Lysobacteraceae bacterium]